MSLLFRVVYAWKCKGTHHKLAVDALRLLQGQQAKRWQDLFLVNFDQYLVGSKAPDDDFKDFRNHVLHVSDGCWGGAITAAEQWYQRTLEALRQERWTEAVYSAGVLSHYVTDPCMPLHTGQSAAENNIHRACEWSVSKSYDFLLNRLTNIFGDFDQAEHSTSEQWLRELITHNATTAHAEYDRIVRQYDFARGVKVPEAGLNEVLQLTFAKLLRMSVCGFAGVLQRMLDESGMAPPACSTSLPTVLAAISVPIDWVTSKMQDANERKLIKEMYQELRATGRLEKNLPEENRTVRELHAQEVAKVIPVPKGTPTPLAATKHVEPLVLVNPKPVPANTPAIKIAEATTPVTPPTPEAITPPVIEKPATLPVAAKIPAASPPLRSLEKLPRFYLELDAPIVDAPSIGPKTAQVLEQAGITHVRSFLERSPEELVSRLEPGTFSVDMLRVWQHQARLMCQVPGLRGHDVQLLVACGVTTPEQLAQADSARLSERANQFVATPAAKRLMRNPQPPELEEVREWISWAAHSRSLRAA